MNRLQKSFGTCAVAYPGVLFGGWGGSTNSDEGRRQRERGSGGGSPQVRGSGGSCNLIQEISFHIVKYSADPVAERGLRRKSAAVRFLRFWVRIPPEAWMFVCCECCVFSGRGICDELITRPEESYRL